MTTRRSVRPWVIAGITFLAIIAAAGFRSTTSALFMPIESEFGWSRDTTSLAVSVNLLFYGLTAPFAAVLMDRFSIRKVATAALLLVAIGSGLTPTMTQSWQLVLYWGVLVGVGVGCTALVFGSMVANRWFVTQRGLVTGIFSASYATGQLVFLPLIAHLVMTVGWRWGSMVTAIFAGVLAPLFWLIFRDSPAAAKTIAWGQTSPDQIPPIQANRTFASSLMVLGKASKSLQFWILAGTFAVCGWTTNGLIGAHFIPAAHDHGMPADTAAGLLATVGIFDLVGTIASGWLTDKIDSRWLLVFYYGLRGLALFSVPVVLGPTVQPPLYFFIIFYGLDWVATVPPTVQLCREYFGLEDSSIVYGWVFASHMVGAAIAAWFAGMIRETQGSYTTAWVTAAILCLLAAASIFALRSKKPRS
jgi:MFS family permease